MRKLFARAAEVAQTVEAGTALSGVSHSPTVIRVAQGRFWVTVEGVERDFWLSAGASIAVATGRLVVIEADSEDGRIEIEAVRPVALAGGHGLQAAARRPL